MYKNINVEAEHNELILENSNGDKVIIPANKRNWVKQKLSEGCHGCIDSLVETLPVVNNYAQDGTVFPNEKQPIVLITPSGRKVETDTDSDFYRTHYNSKLIGKQNEDKSWNLTGEIYQGKPLPEVVVASKIQPNTFADYNYQFNKNNPKDKFLQKKQEEHNKEFYSAPSWAQQAVGWYNDKRKQNDLKRDNEEYTRLQNDFIAEKLLKRTPFEGMDNRVKWLEKFSPKELETIKNSKYASKIEPSIWSKFEQGLLSVGNMGSPVQFKNPSLSQEEAKKEDNALNILQPLNIPSKMVQSAYKDDYSFSDALKGKQNNAGIIEDIVTDPLNLIGLGIWGKLSKANKFKNLDEVYNSVKGLSKEEALKELTKVEKPFKNRIFESNIQLGNPKPNSHISEINYTYRTLGQSEIDDILKTGTVNPRAGKQKGGNENVKYWTKGNGKNWYDGNTIRVKNDKIKIDEKVKLEDLEYLNLSTNQFEPLLSKADKVIDATKVGSKVLNKTDNVAKPIVSSVDNMSKQVTKPAWKIEELPGLHLKSTMQGEAISKIVEPKTGLINTEQALGIIGKESGGADKVALIKQGLGENIPKKMDYNEFRKVVQDQLIPLERQFSTQSSNYGVGRLGYPSPKRSSYEAAIKHNEEMIAHYKKQIAAGSNNSSLRGDLRNAINNLENSKKELATLPLENQTLILGNKSRFGRGSNAHSNPDETLGHVHFLRDAETPDVLTVTQIQSDAFQGTHRIMPKNTPNATALERQQKSLVRMEELQERNKSVLNKMKTEGVDEAGVPVQDYQIKQFEDIVKAQEQSNLFKKADIENFTQKQLLDKNHQERYLQELVDYAGKRGDVNKVRVPTSETAAKVQGYDKVPTERPQGFEGYWDVNTSGNYKPEHQTILKKYSEQPKTIKKLFGVEPKIVTDSKGNTWYEFDIPKKFKEGKGEIKAFQVIPPAIGSAAYLQSQQQNKSEQ